tara:strand:- start:400 stop:897 length:498 start_codon:yes stop_codon:yes gene_type:complete
MMGILWIMKNKESNRTAKSVTAIGYVRFCTGEPSSEGLSIASQVERIRDFCKFRNLDLLEVIIEEEVSATRALRDRKGGALLIEALSKNPESAVVSVQLDRLFQDCLDCLKMVEKWEKGGATLSLINFDGFILDTGSPMGKFFLTVIAGLAEAMQQFPCETYSKQ